MIFCTYYIGKQLSLRQACAPVQQSFLSICCLLTQSNKEVSFILKHRLNASLGSCTCMFEELLNPFKPNGISYYHQLDQYISILRVVRLYFSFLSKFYTLTYFNRTFCKQWRPSSDAAIRNVLSGSALFVYVPQIGR